MKKITIILITILCLGLFMTSFNLAEIVSVFATEPIEEEYVNWTYALT